MQRQIYKDRYTDIDIQRQIYKDRYTDIDIQRQIYRDRYTETGSDTGGKIPTLLVCLLATVQLRRAVPPTRCTSGKMSSTISGSCPLTGPTAATTFTYVNCMKMPK